MRTHTALIVSLVVVAGLFVLGTCSPDNGRSDDDGDERDARAESERDTSYVYDTSMDSELFTYDDGDSEEDGDEDSSNDDGGDPPQDPNCHPKELPEFTTAPFAGGHEFDDILHMTQSPGDPDTYYVVSRKGRIRIVRDGTVLEQPFLDISDKVATSYGEQGLLGLAFHPNYEENGRFFIDYTSNGDWHNVVAEYERSADDPDKANPEEVQKLVNIPDPKKQHNGGTLMFDEEGYLYASLGNGGAKEKRKHDGIGQAQYLGNVFGTIMRMDVDRPEENFAASDNPFVDDEEADGRIFAYGLRNPWRFTVDPATGDMYIGDVGKQSWEEIDFVDADSGGGENFGWPAYLGPDEVVVESAEKAVDEHEKPMFAYKYRSSDALIREGCAVIGGEVYRGDAISKLRGYYVFGDLCSDDLAALRYCDTADEDREPELIDKARLKGVSPSQGLRGIVSDLEGELYLVVRSKIQRLQVAD